jgi:hypothetical protein
MNDRDDVLLSAVQASTGNTRSDMLLEMVRAALPGTTEPGRSRAMRVAAFYNFADVMQEIARYEAAPIDVYRRIRAAVLLGFSPDPGTSDLDNEQPIFVRMTLGDYRAAAQLEDI